jgi:hypothetical protein
MRASSHASSYMNTFPNRSCQNWNPPDKKTWQRKKRHHQHLKPQLGLDHFRGQLSGVMALLRASPNKRVFMSLFQRAYGKQQRLDLGDDLPDMP